MTTTTKRASTGVVVAGVLMVLGAGATLLGLGSCSQTPPAPPTVPDGSASPTATPPPTPVKPPVPPPPT